MKSSSFFVNRPISSTTNHENTAFPARPSSLRESGPFSFSEVFFSTNHCAARGLFCLQDPRIFTKSAAIRAFMNRFQRNSELKLLSASSFEPRGRFSVLLVRLFVILSTAKLQLDLDFFFPSFLPFSSQTNDIFVNFFP